MSFLIAMQAAGMVSSYLSAQGKKKLIQAGADLEQSQFEMNLQALKLQNTQESLVAIKNVRQNIGTQIAINASRNSRGSSSYAGINQSMNAYNTDERMRAINLLTKSTSLMGENVLREATAQAAKRQVDYDLIKQFANQGNQGQFKELGSSLGFNWGA